MPVEFSIGTKVISLGRVADPVIPLFVRTRTGYVPFDFLIDTGADCSIMPAAIAQAELGVDLARCPQDVFFGIEGSGLRVCRGQIAGGAEAFPPDSGYRVACLELVPFLPD